jgi:hypothetical protein
MKNLVEKVGNEVGSQKNCTELREELKSIQGSGESGEVHLTLQVGEVVIGFGLSRFLSFLSGQESSSSVSSFLKTKDVRSRTVLKITDGIEVAVEVR